MGRRSDDERIALNGGFYKARSLRANAQRCVNLFPERNEPDAPTPYTFYPTPGLKPIFAPEKAIVRGCYRATNGAFFVVVGPRVYFVDLIINYGWTLMGTIDPGVNPVQMVDNGTTVVLVDGTAKGYWWTLGLNVFHQIADAAFYGADFAAFLDGFFIFNRPATNQFYISPNFWDGTTPFDSLDIASKIGGSDQIIGIAVIHREIWLVGQLTSEVWFNSGATDFPFERLPGVFIEHGMLRGWSLARTDVSVFFLGRDKDGQCIVLQGLEYQGLRISTYAIENEINKYATVNDAIGFTYQQRGHTFYVLVFPSADRTWVYDIGEKLWHERVWTDVNGAEHRHRANCATNAYGRIICGDFENGMLYAWDDGTYSDNGDPIVRRRTTPHLVRGGKRLSYDSITLDMARGTWANLEGFEPAVSLRWSDDGANSWGDPITLEMGEAGEYNQSLLVRNLGVGPDRVFDIFWDFPYETALQGPWITATPCET